jgi:hypothetical protein
MEAIFSPNDKLLIVEKLFENKGICVAVGGSSNATTVYLSDDPLVWCFKFHNII